MCAPICQAVDYLYLGGQLVGEYKASTTYFFHGDHLGSTRLVSGLGSNQISNPGFESGSSNWIFQSGSSLVADSTRAHSGTDYVQLSAPASGAATLFGQDLPVQQGDQITFGGWAYLESGGGSDLGWLLQAENSSHTGIAWYAAAPKASSPGWTFQTATYTVPAGVSYVALYAQIWQATAASVVRVDDGFLYNDRSSLQVVQNLDYLPFGEINSTDSGTTSHKFTGRVSGFVLANPEMKNERDSETSLDHTWFRQYSSQFGRWTSPDRLGGSIGNPQSLNRYAYALNNPLNLIDPLGLCVHTLYDGTCPRGGGDGASWNEFDVLNIPIVSAEGWIPWTPDSGVSAPVLPSNRHCHLRPNWLLLGHTTRWEWL